MTYPSPLKEVVIAKSRKSVALVTAGALLSVGGIFAYQEFVVGKPIFLSVPSTYDPYFAEIISAAEKEASDSGIGLTVDSADIYEFFDQVEHLMNARNAGTKAVILEPSTVSSANAAVDFLSDAGIPVVSLGCYPNLAKVTSCVTPNYEAGGEQAADALAKEIGETGTVIMFQNYPIQPFNPQLIEGFKKGMAKYPNVKIIDKYKLPNGEEIHPIGDPAHVKEICDDNPDVKAVFSEDESALDVRRVLDAETGSNIKLFGFGGTREALAAISRKEMLGTIDPQADLVAKEAVKQAHALVAGETPQRVTTIDVVKVDSSNLKKFAEKHSAHRD